MFISFFQFPKRVIIISPPLFLFLNKKETRDFTKVNFTDLVNIYLKFVQLGVVISRDILHDILQIITYDKTITCVFHMKKMHYIIN